MKRVAIGDRITVIYDGLLGTHEVFESSKDTGPLEFTAGEGSVLPGFDQAVLGMAENEQKTFTLQPEQAFGRKRQELIHTLKRDAFGERIALQPGMVLGLTIERNGENFKVPAMVLEVRDEEVTVDFNHPLAGQALTYNLTVQAIDKAEPRETAQAEPGM